MENNRTYKYSLALVLLLSGCDRPELAVRDNAELAQYLQRITGNLVLIPGGMLWMRDLRSRMRGEGARCSSEEDIKSPYKVTLSSYSTDHLKMTYEDYVFYLEMAGLLAQQFGKEWQNRMLTDTTYSKNSPAVVSWREVGSYCHQLEKETGLSFPLPTEAWWEYTMRDWGQHILVAADDGDRCENEKDGHGENCGTNEDCQATEEATGVDNSFVCYAINRYPSTSGGLYGMPKNGHEWVSDWYDPDYCAKSLRRDSQGPEKGITLNDDSGQYMKVRRGGDKPPLGSGMGLIFLRGHTIGDSYFPDGTTVRRAMNVTKAVK